MNAEHRPYSTGTGTEYTQNFKSFLLRFACQKTMRFNFNYTPPLPLSIREKMKQKENTQRNTKGLTVSCMKINLIKCKSAKK